MTETDSTSARTPAFIRVASTLLAFALTLVGVAWAADVPIEAGWLVYREQFLAAMLALGLALVYLHTRASRATGGRPPVYDLLASVVGLSVGMYLAATYPALSEELAYNPAEGIVIAAILLVLVVEALRRVAGWALTTIVVLFVIYGLVGHLVPGKLAGREIAFDRLLTQLMLDTNGLLGTPLAIAATIVVVFVLFGNILNRSGGSAFFTDLALALMGRYRGGSAKISIVASSLFGSISGSAVSNVATTGIITIPMMRKSGFAASTAAGIEAVASTGGQLMPPIMGASAFLMAEFLQVGYAEVIVAALVPAVLYYAALFIQADLRAARAGISRVPEDEIPPLRSVLRAGWFFPLPFVVLIVALFWLNFEPEFAGLGAIVAMVLLITVFGYQGRRLTVGQFLDAIRRTGIAVLDILMITAAAGLIIGVLNESGLSFGLTLLLVEIAQDSLAALLLVAALISILLGMGMPTIGVYVLLAALVVPSLTRLGIEPIAAHLFVLYFGMMSMITPPVAIASFAAASLGQTSAMRTAWESMRFGWPAYIVPFLFVLSPSLLLVGATHAIVLAITTALAGVWLVTVGLVGYFGGLLNPAVRVAMAISGLGLMIPSATGGWAIYTNVACALLALLLLGAQVFVRGRKARA